MAKAKIKEDSPVLFWINELSAAEKREKDFRKDGLRVEKIYEGAKPDDVPFNIFYSNVETLLPALYSAIPVPVVERRFKDADPIGLAASEAGERGLKFLLDTNVEGYETFDRAMNSAVLDALVPGRGVTCVKYDAQLGEIPGLSIDEDDPEEKPEPVQYKKGELVCLDTRSWNRVLFGYAKKWSKVPWIAYEEDIDKEEATRLFGKEIADKLTFAKSEKENSKDKEGEGDKEDRGERETCRIYQIWDREGNGKPDSEKKIRYVSATYPDDFLLVQDDPLEITGFFSCPMPLQFLAKSNKLKPISPYLLYENQAKELNELTRRISRITKAIKAKGVYDAELGEDIKNIVEADDNDLVPADKSSSLAAENGIQNAIWMWPVDKLITVLRELLNARESCKQVIYEITGIADIMRGQTQASETLGAQQIKQSWGTLRLKRQQKEVMRYSRDLLRMMLEVAANKFSEETWAKMTGLPYLTTQQYAQAQAVLKAAQMQAQVPGPNGQPNPQAQQQLQQAQQALQQPQWSQVLALLKDDLTRAYRIDIETNSTIEVEATEDQKNITDIMNAIGQAMNSLGPLVAKGILPFEAAKAMLLTIVRRMRFGKDIEEQINQMQAPPQADPNAQAQQESQQKAQLEQQRMQMQDQQAQRQEQRLAAADAAKAQREQAAEANKMAMEQAQLASEERRALADIEAKKQARLAELQAERATAERVAQIQRESDREKAALQAAVAIETARINSTKDAAEGTTPQAGQDMNQIMAAIMDRTTTLLEQVTKPRGTVN